MKIDFTRYTFPQDALDLEQWQRDRGVQLDVAEAKVVGIDRDALMIQSQYRWGPCEADIVLTPRHAIKLEVEGVIADFRPNDSLRSLRMQTAAMRPAELVPIARPIVQDWRLHAQGGQDPLPDALADEAQSRFTPEKLDGVQQLERWQAEPPNTLPSFVAQSDSDPAPGVWFMRLLILPCLEDDGNFVLSAQVFWRDPFSSPKSEDTAYWERADAVIDLANQQASQASIPQVAESLLFAAARYNAFDYWCRRQDRQQFQTHRAEAMESCVELFRSMLQRNLDEHLARWNDAERH